MLKLIHLVLLLIGVASAAQTRIKIGSSSWGYQIEQGPNVRTEFASDDGVASGFYQFRVGNETKKLEYRIDPNSREPDISFNVVNVDDSAVPPSPSPTASSPSDADKEEISTTTTTASTADPTGNNNSTSTTNSPTPISNNSTSSNEVVMSSSSRSPSSSVSSSNMTFDSIDSKQDFKGHVTLKVGNSTYTINFVTGDKAHTREETLLPSGMMFGRFSYLLQRGGSSSSPNKLVINYKFNSTSPDPTFEVSLYKTIESEPPSSGSSSHFQPPTTPRDGYSRQVSYPARDRYNSIHHHQQPSSSVSSPIISPSSSSGSSSSAIPSVRSQQQHYAALAEKYRERVAASQQQAGGGGGGVVPPNWYYNRGKPVIYDP